ncbi:MULTISPECIES: exo-alpha-sialidase [Bacteroides]|jgi:hypothetical protein|uniref:exo-alpha-sialidase n=1 Tax=Bacteroides TaxID=816 RepID=UPI001F1D5408|nr:MULTISPECIES: exo-alpha-sialidase [Bacteroides]
MKTMKIKSYLWVLALTAFSCSDETTAQNSIVPPVEPPVEEETFVDLCNFETTLVSFHTNDQLKYNIVDNPYKEGVNASNKCGKVVSAGDMWELIWSDPLAKKFDFTKDGACFSMQVRSPKVGGHIFFKLESSLGADAKEISNVVSKVANEWETLEFDFSVLNLPDNVYDKVIILFDAGETGSGEEWYFDNIRQKTGVKTEPEPEPGEKQYINYCNFETSLVTFRTNDRLEYSIVDNPHMSGINTSSKCGKVVAAGDQWELIWSEPVTSRYNSKFNFSKNGGRFTVKVYSPKVGSPVYFKLESTGGADSKEMQNVKTTVANQWETLTFDFTSWNLPDETYDKIVIVFDAGIAGGAGDVYYFDDIVGPNNEAEQLLTRYEANPVLTYQGAERWMCEHIANAAILSPTESPDGNWWMYARGSGYDAMNEYHDQIGLFRQSASSFNPVGGWEAYPTNPVIPHGAKGTCDELHLLDCAPVMGGDGKLYFYYQAVRGTADADRRGSLACRYSADGGYTFSDAVMLRDGVGCSDAIFHDGKYYIFYGYGYDNGSHMKIDCAITTDPMSFDNAEIRTILTPGGGPANHDCMTVNGSRIFRLKDVNKWFMIYQGSTRHFDFPERFHVAYSDDLLNWTKVNNTKPFFKRGEAETWDQGGIWFGEVLEYGDKLYMYYEGWGCEGAVPDRDYPYFGGGHSTTGCASVSKGEFLKWCGLN